MSSQKKSDSLDEGNIFLPPFRQTQFSPLLTVRPSHFFFYFFAIIIIIIIIRSLVSGSGFLSSQKFTKFGYLHSS
jgi:hypothetical protein